MSFIINRVVNGTHQPAAHPRQHSTLEHARNEAERLAAKHRGDEFVVLELRGSSKAPVNVPTSRLRSVPAGWYECIGCGDAGMEAYKPTVKFAVVGIDDGCFEGYAPVTFFFSDLKVSIKPTQRNLRWVPCNMKVEG